MKMLFIRTGAVIGSLAACTGVADVSAQSGGGFSVQNSVAAAAQTTSRGGSFSLMSTVGQPEVGRLQGGSFVLESGFWHGITLVQSSNAPGLKIGPGAPGYVVLSWPIAAEGWSLQETANLQTGVWTTSPQAVVKTVTEHTVTVPANGPMRCYRLKKL